MRCCCPLEGKKSAQQIKPTPPHGRDGSLRCTDAVMEQDDAWIHHLPWFSGNTQQDKQLDLLSNSTSHCQAYSPTSPD